MSYIQNEHLKLGIDLNLGGAVTYLADVRRQENLINNFDWGRQVQMSFYSGPVPYETADKKPHKNWTFIGWNPIQSGDVAGNRSRVIAHKKTKTGLYVKCIPMHWPLDGVPGECTFESWIHLKGNAVQVRSRIVNHRRDTTQYAARGQELPAVYTNAPYHRLVTYRGDQPFTNDTLSTIRNHNSPSAPEIRWADWQATENWAASVNDDNYGLAIWNEAVQGFSGGFFGDQSFRGGSKDISTGYISPVNVEVLDHNITYEYTYSLILGTVDQIRAHVYKNRSAGGLPCYTFRKDRQHWVYENTTDAGWPIRNGLLPKPAKEAAMRSPYTFWQAEKAPRLVVEAIHPPGGASKITVYWRPLNGGFDAHNSREFTVIPDGKPHTYTIPLHQSDSYKGPMSGLRISLPAGNDASSPKRIQIKSVCLNNN
ncbi:hypothetical protein ACFQ4C_21720 [Larkinella insperata]|uniref:Uncharacterized protein n=1 Tax=Larkinella insperata TaxID=332158 RepID=A0ABW3Q8R1_9BACT